MKLRHDKRADAVFQLRISLDGIEPAIWRRVLVPGSWTLRRLHGVIQKSMGWTNSHLHKFQSDGRELGRPDPDGVDYFEDDSRWRLRDFLFAPGDRLAYEYDFGDSWAHTILLEEIHEPDGGKMTARCVAGARACPPEDCGGLPGYQHFLEAMLDPFHPEHRDMREWIGGKFDAEAFDVDEANRRLARRGR